MLRRDNLARQRKVKNSKVIVTNKEKAPATPKAKKTSETAKLQTLSSTRKPTQESYPRPSISPSYQKRESEPRKDYKKDDKLQPATRIAQHPGESRPSTPSRQDYAPVEKPQIRRKPFVDNYELPANYNTTGVTLMARDPHWIHAYWEVAPSTMEAMRKSLGSELDRSTHTLRMYDVTYKDFNGNNANHWFDINVGPQSNNRHINLWDDNVTYCSDIGISTPDGRFLTLARSNSVATPRAGSSGRADMIWMEVKDDLRQPPYVIAETREEGVRSLSSTKKISPREKGSTRRVFLTEDDIRIYYSKLFPLLKQVISARLERESGTTREFGGKRIVHVDSSNPRYKIYIKDGNILLEDFLIGDLSRSQFLKKILLGSSEELVLPGGASEFARGGASEREKKKRKFFFEIGTELIVYGRTEPDAEVWLGDKKVTLRNDGTFTLRFALPDGKIPLDFVARSHDKVDERSIKTAVERTETKYNP